MLSTYCTKWKIPHSRYHRPNCDCCPLFIVFSLDLLLFLHVHEIGFRFCYSCLRQKGTFSLLDLELCPRSINLPWRRSSWIASPITWSKIHLFRKLSFEHTDTLVRHTCQTALPKPNFSTMLSLPVVLILTHLVVPVLFCSLAVLDRRVGHTMDVLSPFISVLCHSDWLFH